MNKYLAKISELTQENKQVNKTFLSSWGPSLVGDVAGMAIGSKLGKGFKGFTARAPKALGGFSHHFGGEAIGAGLGGTAAGGIAEYAGLKHSLKGKIKEPGNE